MSLGVQAVGLEGYRDVQAEIRRPGSCRESNYLTRHIERSADGQEQISTPKHASCKAATHLVSNSHVWYEAPLASARRTAAAASCRATRP